MMISVTIYWVIATTNKVEKRDSDIQATDVTAIIRQLIEQQFFTFTGKNHLFSPFGLIKATRCRSSKRR